MLGRSALLAATNSGDIGWQGAYSNVSLLLRNGAPVLLPVDESPTPKTITTFGDAEISTTTFKYGGSSLAFDGNGDHATIPFDAGFEFGTGDFTVEGWFYFVDINTTLRGIVALGDGANGSGPVTNSWGLQYLGSEGSNQIAFSRYNGTTTFQYTTTGVSVTPNSWHHIAVCRGSGILRIFFNGVSYYSASNAVNYSVVNASHPLRVALQYYGPQATYNGPRYWNGFIDDLRITKGVARYTSNFSSSLPAELPANATDDPHYSDVSLLLRNGTPSGLLIPLDESPTPKAITTFGNAGMSTTTFKYGGSSLAFDGSGDYLSLDGSSDFVFGINDFTIEMWAYVNSPGNTGALYDARPLFTTGAYPMIYSASNTIRYQIFTSDVIVSSSVPLNAWIHIALCRASNSTRLFINGIQNGNTYTDTNNYLNGGSGRPVIGANGPNLALNNFNGYIDDLRITKGIARYTSNFTPPPAELPNF